MRALTVPVRPVMASEARNVCGDVRAVHPLEQAHDVARRGAVGARQARAVDDLRAHAEVVERVAHDRSAGGGVPWSRKRAPSSRKSISAAKLFDGTLMKRASSPTGRESEKATVLASSGAKPALLRPVAVTPAALSWAAKRAAAKRAASSRARPRKIPRS